MASVTLGEFSSPAFQSLLFREMGRTEIPGAQSTPCVEHNSQEHRAYSVQNRNPGSMEHTNRNPRIMAHCVQNRNPRSMGTLCTEKIAGNVSWLSMLFLLYLF